MDRETQTACQQENTVTESGEVIVCLLAPHQESALPSACLYHQMEC